MQKHIKKLTKDGYIKRDYNVYSSINDKLKYRTIALDNKMKIFLIQDDDSNISSANMLVNVGHMHNPESMPGMAHYLEHMLFMGSDIYPGGNFFQNKVAENSGFTNAFTTNNNTQYFFSSCSSSFIELLHIFSRFFINPAFKTDVTYVKKEISAVESEHNKNKNDDGWRMMQLSKLFFTDKINGKFGTGSRETLLGSNNNDIEKLRDALSNFYDNHYSSDKMILFISHNNLSDNVINIISTYFDQVPLKNTINIDNTAQVKIYDDKYELIKMKGISGNNLLTLEWIIMGSEQYIENERVDSYDVLSYILGHEGKNSLYEMLTRLGLIISLIAGVGDNFNTNACFYINVRLTDKGYANWNQVMYIIICYIQRLYFTANSDNNDAFKKFSNEIGYINLMNSLTILKTNGLDTAHTYANMYITRNVDLEYVPISSLLFNNKMTNMHFLSTLKQMTLSNAKVLLVSDKIDDTDRIEMYYGTEYSYDVKDVDYNEIKKCHNLHLNLPDMNKYMPRDIKIIHPIDKNNELYFKIDSGKNNIYYVKKSNSYNSYINTGLIVINLESLKTNDSTVYMMILLHILYIDKIKNAEIYMMNMAGIYVDIFLSKNELTISMNGYIDKSIFTKIFEWYFVVSDKNKHLEKIDRNIYEIVYNDTLLELMEYQYSTPFTRISSEFINMLNPNHTISNIQMLKSSLQFSPFIMNNIDSVINYNNFRKKTIELMTSGNMKGIFGGSIHLTDVNYICNLLDNTINYKNNNNVYELDLKNIKKIVPRYNSNDGNIAIGYGIYLANIVEKKNGNWKKLRLYSMLAETFLSDKFYSHIRTERELGYVAHCRTINVNEAKNADMYLLFIAQTNRQDGEDIINNYIDVRLINDIKSLTDNQFNSMKNGLLVNLYERSQNIGNELHEKFMALKMKYGGYSQTESFDRKLKLANSLEHIDKNEFIHFLVNAIQSNPRAIILIK